MADEFIEAGVRRLLGDVVAFSQATQPGRTLRSYQQAPARTIAESVTSGAGLQLAAVFARQSGKDEMLAQVCAHLLWRYHQLGGEIVVAQPALRPQGIISRDRLLARLQHPVTRDLVRVREGTIVEVGRASARFLSAAPGANSRGNTASLLLVANEAQDIQPDVWDAVFAPMAASTNASTLFMGTVWSSRSLLARQLRLLAEQEREDGERRIFRVPWQDVAAELPAYGDYVRRQMALLGPHHPFIRTEYELLELDGESALFGGIRRDLLQGDFPLQTQPNPGERYVFTIDVAGEMEDGSEGEQVRNANPRRDSTALTIFRIVDHERAAFQLLARYLWTGTRQTLLHERIVALAQRWKPTRVVVDATGIGGGLSSFLRVTLGGRVVVPFVFTSTSKSKLAWDMLGMLESGRVTIGNAADADPEQQRWERLFWRQLDACHYVILPGPGRLLRWGVEDPTLHDDLLISFALVAALEQQDLRPRIARGYLDL